MDKPVQHIDEDGSIYAVEIVPPEGNDLGSKYHVDMVRSSVDEQGLAREQRLTVGEHHSWGEAEEHLYDLEDRLEDEGVSAWEKNVEQLREQPFEPDVLYMAVTYPPDALEGDQPTVSHLLAIQEQGIDKTPLAVGDRDFVERSVKHIDFAMATQDINDALDVAEREGISNGTHSPPTPLFNAFGQTDSPVQHVDGGGTAHWFDIVERDGHDSELYELRYFRTLDLEDGGHFEDSYPVMPLTDDDPSSAWALPGLESYLQKGDVYMAQQFAHDIADAYEQEFPEPLDLPALDPRPEYYFGYGVGPNNKPALEAVKTWMEGAERCFDTLTMREYDMFDDAVVDEHELGTLMAKDGLEVAMNLAEQMAITAGYLDADRDDPRMFFEDDAPSDPFKTNRERELAKPHYSVGSISTNNEAFLEVSKEWGTDDYERLVIPQPNWVVAHTNARLADEMLEEDRLQDAMRLVETEGIKAGIIDADRDDPRLFTQGPLDPFQTVREEEIDDTLASYGVTWREAHQWASEAERTPDIKISSAEVDTNRQLLEPLDASVNYALVVQTSDPDKVELAVEKTWQGIEGSVETTSQTLQTYASHEDYDSALSDRDDLMDVYDDRGLQAMMHKAELQATRNGHLNPHRADLGLFDTGPPDRFVTLAQQLEEETNPYWNVVDEDHLEVEGAVENPYWRLETLPVNDPDGEPLGHALHMIVYDDVEYDPEQIGTPNMSEDEPFRMLEMAHFETTEAADKFGKDFNGYLMPGVLEGPELAEEVARLEEHPIEWKTFEGDDLKSFQNGEYRLIRDSSDWHLYNPNAEREARIMAEGETTPLDVDSTLEDKDDVKVSPDFDL